MAGVTLCDGCDVSLHMGGISAYAHTHTYDTCYMGVPVTRVTTHRTGPWSRGPAAEAKAA